MITLCCLTACSAPQESELSYGIDRSMSGWQRADVDYSAARRLQSAGFSSMDAEEWKAMGKDPLSMLEWQTLGISTDSIVPLEKSTSLSTGDLQHWLGNLAYAPGEPVKEEDVQTIEEYEPYRVKYGASVDEIAAALRAQGTGAVDPARTAKILDLMQHGSSVDAAYQRAIDDEQTASKAAEKKKIETIFGRDIVAECEKILQPFVVFQSAYVRPPVGACYEIGNLSGSYIFQDAGNGRLLGIPNQGDGAPILFRALSVEDAHLDMVVKIVNSDPYMSSSGLYVQPITVDVVKLMR